MNLSSLKSSVNGYFYKFETNDPLVFNHMQLKDKQLKT